MDRGRTVTVLVEAGGGCPGGHGALPGLLGDADGTEGAPAVCGASPPPTGAPGHWSYGAQAAVGGGRRRRRRRWPRAMSGAPLVRVGPQTQLLARILLGLRSMLRSR